MRWFWKQPAPKQERECLPLIAIREECGWIRDYPYRQRRFMTKPPVGPTTGEVLRALKMEMG